MRDFLEDAHKHQDHGYGRHQQLLKPQLPKRFYKQAGTAPVEGGYAVTLDGRQTRTPGDKVPVVLPTLTLAESLAAEWAAQGAEINAETMPMVRLVNSALEGGQEAMGPLREEILKYASSDLLLYRADAPQELVAEQEAHWDAVLVTLARHFGVKFRPTVGIMFEEQPTETLDKLGSALDGLGLLSLTALTSITGLTGSGLLAIALRHGLVERDGAWAAAHVDENHNIRLWGEDSEASRRRAKRRIEYDAALRVFDLSEGN